MSTFFFLFFLRTIRVASAEVVLFARFGEMPSKKPGSISRDKKIC